MTSAVKLPATRWGAFFSHLFLSLSILIALAAFIAFVMFPGALFSAAGGIEGLKIIAGVDIILGPLLTLIIYNRAKPIKELMRDLFIIGFIQIAALTAGMYLVHKSRPAAITYAFDKFHTTKAHEFDENDASERPDTLKLFTPAYFNLKLPEDHEEARSLMAEFEFMGPSPRLNTDLFEPLERDPEPLSEQLRLSLDDEESIEQECLVRTLVTAFDTVDVCFDPQTLKFSKHQTETE